MEKSNTKKMVTIAMMSAVAYLLALLFHFLPIPPFVPAAPFLKFEPKDIIIVITGFMYGPLVIIPMSLIVGLLEMPFSATWLYGLIMNVASTCAFAIPAAFIYKKWRTITGGAIGLVAGVIITTGVMIPLNYLITPFFMGIPRHAVVTILISGIGVFNFVKYTLVAAFTMQLYIPLKKALSKAKLIPEQEAEAKSTEISINSILISIAVVLLCIIGILYLNGMIFAGF